MHVQGGTSIASGTSSPDNDSRRAALVVEDESHVSLLLAQILDGLGFDPTRVPSAEHADQHLTSNEVDLVLLDLRLPGRSGDSWLVSFRGRDRVTPVIAISGVNDPERKAAVLRAGADDFVGKPFQVIELEARIDSLMRRRQSQTRQTLCNGLVCLDPARCELRVGDLRQSLTMREFGILWCLASSWGRWVNVATLSEAVLGEASEAAIETVRVHLFNLRHKLEHFAPLLLVAAARNRGYRILTEDGPEPG
jgi:DNA-binding response OmpR family regulator